jgi:hypothetical protein
MAWVGVSLAVLAGNRFATLGLFQGLINGGDLGSIVGLNKKEGSYMFASRR